MTGIRPLPWLLAAFVAGMASSLAALWLAPGLLRLALPAGQAPATSPLDQGGTSFAGAVRRAAPGVVSVFSSVILSQRQPLATKDARVQRRYGQLGADAEHQRRATSLGSGVILAADGLILTNRHVVKDANRIQVELANGHRLPVRVLGFDPETDLAVLRADARNLPTLPMGNPKSVQVGDVVLAIGNPFGVGQTVTLGIVSATRRTDLGLSGIENFIQTDAAINPGNSGGALIDSRGALVGINTAIYSESGTSEGVGFAIPADLAQGVASQLLASGKVARGWLGIGGRSMTPTLAETFGLRTQSGVLVSSTAEGSPAERAGLHPGDVITRVGGKPIIDTQQLLELVAGAGPAVDVVLEVWRGSERLEVKPTTMARP